MKRWILLFILAATVALAQAGHYNALTWTWSQGTGDSSVGFKVYKASTTGGPYTLLATLTGTTVMTYNDSAVIAGQTNYYVVTAYTTVGGGAESAYSNEVKCVTPFQEIPPSGLSGIAH